MNLDKYFESELIKLPADVFKAKVRNGELTPSMIMLYSHWLQARRSELQTRIALCNRAIQGIDAIEAMVSEGWIEIE